MAKAERNPELVSEKFVGVDPSLLSHYVVDAKQSQTRLLTTKKNFLRSLLQ